MRDEMKHVVLTGVSRGLGKALFGFLVSREDVHLIGMGRMFPKDVLDEKSANHVACHLSEPETLPPLKDIIPKDGDVIFINNAGTVAPIGAVGTLSEDQLRNAAAVNYISPMLLSNQLVALCKENGQKLRIVNISSGAAHYPISGWAAYCSSKAAFKMFLDVAAEQEKSEGRIEVVHVDPGVMDTGMQEQIRASDADGFPRLAEFQAYKTTGKLRTPEEVAQQIIREYIP